MIFLKEFQLWTRGSRGLTIEVETQRCGLWGLMGHGQVGALEEHFPFAGAKGFFLLVCEKMISTSHK